MVRFSMLRPHLDSRSGAAVQRVPFKRSINVSPEGSFAGRIAEPATFGSGSSSELYANVTGGVNASAWSLNGGTGPFAATLRSGHPLVFRAASE